MKKSIITKNLKSTRKSRSKRNYSLFIFKLFTLAVISVVSLNLLKIIFHNDSYASSPDYIWKVRSIDTMKTSRDMARAKLNDPSYDIQIEKQIGLIKSLGANYVAIDTPYDDEFLPFLKRWVSIARAHDLKIWFRGNWSGWEGWFDYPKSLSPGELIEKTKNFIKLNPDLFVDEDIFDACPECENSGYWPQPQSNSQYNDFLIKKNMALSDSFNAIHKKVIYNWNSIIGGRAKDVLNAKTLDSLGNVVAIDHYHKNANDFQNYVDYFKKNNTNLVISEFGAPIPDINGTMDQEQQAHFIDDSLYSLYKNKNNILGVNYWVLNVGTTALVNEDLTLKPVASVIKKYYSPAIIRGIVINKLGENLKGVKISTQDHAGAAFTDEQGKYQITIPAGKAKIMIEAKDYKSSSINVSLVNQQIETYVTTLQPIKPNFIYNLRLRFMNFIR